MFFYFSPTFSLCRFCFVLFFPTLFYLSLCCLRLDQDAFDYSLGGEGGWSKPGQTVQVPDAVTPVSESCVNADLLVFMLDAEKCGAGGYRLS